MKNILVLIHDDEGQEARLQAALDVTRAVRGHLTCVDVTAVTPLVTETFGVSGGAMLLEEERASESANRARIEARLPKEDITWDMVAVTDYVEPAIEGAATLADLIVVNRAFEALPQPDLRDLAASLVVKSGKPVLAVPEEPSGFPAYGRALVAWDGSRDAAAALEAALPLLGLAGKVTILELDDGKVKVSAEEAAAYLSRHDILPVVRREGPEGSIEEALLAEANGGGFDYLVMGGFSRSRLVEAVFGGASHRLLSESRIPVLMAR